MTWKTGTIRFAAAQAIFHGVQFKELLIGDKVAGYSAEFNGVVIEHQSLTDLCAMLWLRYAKAKEAAQ
jgi:hypothetical protein